MKVKKRSQQNQLTAKRSLMQIIKKWPNFNQNPCNTPATPLPNSNHKVLMEDLDALGQRVISLETNLIQLTNQFENQNRVNCCALQNFQKLKNDFEELSCEFKEYQKSNDEEECEDESGTEESEIDEEIDYADEIKWLKERMLEISESLKVQSECLKNIKCTEMPQLKNYSDEKYSNLSQIFDSLQQEHRKDVDNLRALSGNELVEIKSQLDIFNEEIKSFEKQFESQHDELLSMRDEFMEKLQKSLVLSNNKDYNEHGDDDHLDATSQSICISISQRLCQIQKQVMSQSVCLQQLVRDLSYKVDKCEFERYTQKIEDIVKPLIQFKKDFQVVSSNTAAGTCISCQTSANMLVTNSNVPKLPSLKFGRENINEESFCCRTNWNGCNNFKQTTRRVGGNHTKVNRSLQVKSMRFKRLKTPCYVSTKFSKK